jgi:thiol-disulfide isomerase/thioredoxin
MLKKSLFSILFLSALVFQGCSDNENNKTEHIEQIAALAKKNTEQKYVLTSTDGRQFVIQKTDDGFILKDSDAKIVIFDIFATWCPPCQASAQHLSSIQKKFKKDVVVIGLTIEENIPNANLIKFKHRFHANYIISNSPDNRPLITEIASQLKVGARFPIPLMTIYKDGKLVSHYIGAVEEEFVESDIKQALGK